MTAIGLNKDNLDEIYREALRITEEAMSDLVCCEKCGKEIITGLMAVYCEHGDDCECMPEDEEGRAFVRECRKARETT